MLWLFVLLTSDYGAYSQSLKAQFCPPGDDWIFCAKEETDVKTCTIPDEIFPGQATISYGTPDTAFVFYDVSNNNPDSFEFGCSDGRLGDPAKGWKGCCYRQGPIDYNYSISYSDWTYVGEYGSTYYTNGVKLIKYQKSGSSQAFYRWMEGEVDCNEDYFPYWEPYGQSKSARSGNRCYVYSPKNAKPADYTPSGFVNCGTNGGECDVPANNAGSMSLVRYGTNTGGMYAWAYGSAYSPIPCQKMLFNNYNGAYCDVQNRTVFPASQVLGKWVDRLGCGGCTGTEYDITWGTTSQSKQAGKPSWVQALGDVVSAGIQFVGIPLSSEISGAISDLVEPSYSVIQTSSTTCKTQCGNATTADWHIWQWVMSTDEYVETGVDAYTSSFNINACQFQCNTESTPPKCPPGYCTDFACQTCKPFN